MPLVITEEQKMLKDAAKELLQSKASIDQFRSLRDQGYQPYDESTWNEMVEMGWTALTIPEQYNGLDFGYVGLGQILEESGRTLTKSPLVSSILFATTALRFCDNEALKAQWLSALMNGRALMALAVDEKAYHDPEAIEATIKQSGENYSLSGSKTFVANAKTATHLIVAAKSETGTGLFLVDVQSTGIEMRHNILLDTGTYSDIQFDKVTIPVGNRLDKEMSGESLLEKTLDIAGIGLAAEMLGSILEAFEKTMEYIKERQQFGVKIGTYQALQHRAAVMFSEIELCKSIVLKALQAIDEEDEQLSRYASLAKAKLGKTIKLVTNEATQMHGGIGVTDDSNIGFYLKRARVAQKLMGDYNFHLDRLAKLKGF